MFVGDLLLPHTILYTPSGAIHPCPAELAQVVTGSRDPWVVRFHENKMRTQHLLRTLPTGSCLNTRRDKLQSLARTLFFFFSTGRNSEEVVEIFALG